MRRYWTSLVLLAPALGLAGCGAGGAAPLGAEPEAATLQGLVLDVDGDSAATAGITLVCEETGETVTSGPDGTFAFDALPEGDVTLALGGTLAKALAASTRPSLDDESDDDDTAEDDAGDDTERSDRHVRIRRIRRGDRVVVHVRIVDGRIVDIRFWRHGRDDAPDGGEREIEIEMHKTDANDDPDMTGEIELAFEADGDQEFEVEVEDAEVGLLLEAVVIDPDGNEDSLGFRAVELDGDAEWKLDTGDGDDLPFGVAHLARLEKHLVVVRNADGVALLGARLPDFPPRGDLRDRCFRLRGRARLVPELDGVRGFTELRAAGCFEDRELVRLRQVMLIAARGLGEGREVEFFVADPDNGQLTSLGTVVTGADGGAFLVFDTMDGDDLPFGAQTVRELTGLDVEVRDDVTGDVLLHGQMPGVVQE